MLLLPYSVNIQALSASTANFINGSRPYLTFDGGVTKATTTEDLLGITLSDGTSITPATNTSSEENPIVLPNVEETFNDIDMLIPINTNSIALNELIGAPNNYWGDDDGDGQGINGVKVTGSLNVKITDKLNRNVDRDAVLSICNAPYKVVITGTDGSLTTEYGYPNSSIFTSSSVTYYIRPKQVSPVICYIKPILDHGSGAYAGPANVWTPNRGFSVQSTDHASYNRNFPTTGANNLYFDIEIQGGSELLTWPSVTLGGVTATMTPNKDGTIRVTLTNARKPSLPQTFELIGYDSSNNVVLKYGFVLKAWFINHGSTLATLKATTNWCSNMGYRIAKVRDITNAVCRTNLTCKIQSAIPSSSGNYYQRRVGAGVTGEWGSLPSYSGAGFYNTTAFYWIEEDDGVYLANGSINWYMPITKGLNGYGICVYP